LPAHRSAPLLHGRGGCGRELTDFGACICEARVAVSLGARLLRRRDCTCSMWLTCQMTASQPGRLEDLEAFSRRRVVDGEQMQRFI
jgi:hypothetical protein